MSGKCELASTISNSEILLINWGSCITFSQFVDQDFLFFNPLMIAPLGNSIHLILFILHQLFTSLSLLNVISIPVSWVEKIV